MAEAFLQVLIENLSSLIQKEIGIIIGVDKEMKKLQSILTTIQSVLEDAETKPQNKPIQNWLSKLNDTALQIDDILDECTTEFSKFERRGGKLKHLKKILFRLKMGKKIKEISETMDDLAAERRNFHLREIVLHPSSEVDCRRETGSIITEPDYVTGRDQEREKIVDMLLNQASDSEQLSVIPIIGVGGLGKTTLTQLVFNDQRVTQHFDTKLWVCVSDNFDLKILLEAMIVSATGAASNLVQLEALQRRLREVLNLKRYLMVLDDVWNDDQESWAKLKSILECGSKGASIVVSTRLKIVGDIMGTLPTHYLEGLSDEDLWVLFKLRAFGNESEAHPNLETIGRQIVKKCAGVPLAAKALGGLLRFKRKQKEWILVEESEIWDLPEEETMILPALRLSYHHLPLRLRRCFAYCAVFPKDTRMEKKDLIFHWMSHGCISSNEVFEVEDIGDQIWNELVLRSLFQQVSVEGTKTTFMMHDLVHDLAHSIMENKVVGATNESKFKVRNVSSSDFYITMDCSSSICIQVSTLSTIMDYSRLRILKFNMRNVKELPSAIGKLKHMRYIDLSYCIDLRSLPNTICSLWNLQILILDDCLNLERLPKHMKDMTNLRHIFLEGCGKISEMPSSIGDLNCLQTLSIFVVGYKVDNQIDQLQHLNLRGKLVIRHLERTKNHMYAEKANLVGKPNLRHLVLSSTLDWRGDEEMAKAMDEKVLEALEPHSNLETLEISGFEGSYIPLWLTKMKNLTEMSLKYAPNCSHIPLGDLVCLKSLHLAYVDRLEYIMDHNRTFPSLEKVRLVHLSNLKRVVKVEVHGEVMFPNLRELYIEDCELLMLPTELSNLERLSIVGCSPLTLSSKAKLGNLTYLDLDFGDIRTTTSCIQEGTWEGLCNLRELQIKNAGEQHLPEKWLQGLISLKTLDVQMSLVGRWLRHLTGIEVVSISNCFNSDHELVEEIKHLRLLKHLRLTSTHNIVSVVVPQGLHAISNRSH